MTEPERKLTCCEGCATVTNAILHLFITAATYSGLIGGGLTLCVCVYIFVAAQDIKKKGGGGAEGWMANETSQKGCLRCLRNQRHASRLFLLIRRRFVHTDV